MIHTARSASSRLWPAGRMSGASFTMWSRPTTPVAAVAMAKIKEIFEIERRIVAEPPKIRLRARKLSKLKIFDFFVWSDDILARASACSPLAEALRYTVRLKSQLLAYTEGGRLEIDNNLAENTLRGICLRRKNWLCAVADCGGERAAAMYSLIETGRGDRSKPFFRIIVNRRGLRPTEIMQKLDFKP